MRAVFADAFYFVGLINREDQHHARAIAAANRLHEDVVTTEWILAEFADALAKSASRRLVAKFIRDLQQDPKVRIIRAELSLLSSSLWLMRQIPAL